MTCIIIEDQPPAQRILTKYIADYESLELLSVFNNAIEGIEFLKNNPVDLMFLDIHLPKMSGIDFLKILPQRPAVILTTAFSDYALESYDLDVVDYLLKPFSFQRFAKAVSKVPTKSGAAGSTGDTSHEIFIKSGYDHIRISTSDILFIKSDADYSEIFLPGKKHLSAEPLRKWLEQLNPEIFVRVHKSYIINTKKIEKVSGNQIQLVNQETIPIGRAFREAFMKRFL